MVLTCVLQDVSGSDWVFAERWIPGMLGWMAAVLLVDKIKSAQRWQIATIAGLGLAMHAVALSRGVEIDVSRAVGINASLISMIAAVGFLRLVVNPGAANEKLPTGNRPYYRTLAGVWLFGSVINISAPILFADRLSRREGLSPLAAQSIVRVFTTCSGWSPFFGGMAVVITYVPDMNLGLVILICLPFSLFGLALVLLEAKLRYAQQMQEFRGYPVQFSSLWVPALLALIVVMLAWLAPGWSVLTHISVGALTVSFFGLKLQNSWAETWRALSRQVTEHVPAMVNELSLFLVAGVLAAGLASVLSSDIGWVPSQGFGLIQASSLLGFMVLLAVVGVHPVVTVSGATPLVMSLNPDPNLLAVVYLLAWSLGTCASPLSGTHLVFQGRYGVSNWRAAAGNWPFVAVLYIAATPFLYWVMQMLGL
jgi:hypothetical protein